jgi:hypothetical protein
MERHARCGLMSVSALFTGLFTVTAVRLRLAALHLHIAECTSQLIVHRHVKLRGMSERAVEYGASAIGVE